MANGVHPHGSGREKAGIHVAVVIAAYNEEEIIVPLTEALIEALNSLPDASWQLIYVIEGTDSTMSRAEVIARDQPNITLLYNERPSGLGRAFRSGFDAVPLKADYVVTMDA